MTKFHMVRAGLEHLDQVQDLFVRSIRGSCTGDYTPMQIDGWTSSVEDRQRWIFKVSDTRFFMAYRGDKLAGIVSLKGKDYLDMLFVDPLQQRQGVAGFMLDFIEELARKAGAKVIYSDVSITARPFFEKKGFEVIKTNHNGFRGVVLVNFSVRKVLS